MKPRRHSDWHKLVPEVLIEKPPVWRGLLPAKADAWRAFTERRDAFRHEGLVALKTRFRIPHAVDTDEFLRDLAVHLLDLFPRFQTVKETRGLKRRRVVDPDSLIRRIKRDRRTAKDK